MTTNAAYGRATMAYRASNLLIHEPASIGLALHQKLYMSVTSARLAQEQNRLDEMTLHVQAATSVLTAMRLHMNFELAGSEGRRLADFYRRLQRQIVSAGMFRNRSELWSNISDQIRSVMVEMSRVSSRKQ